MVKFKKVEKYKYCKLCLYSGDFKKCCELQEECQEGRLGYYKEEGEVKSEI